MSEGERQAMDSRTLNALRRVLAHYDLGELVEYEKNERGFVNSAYAISMLDGGERKRYFLRKYKRGIGQEELAFEHSLIEHLVAAGSPVAGIHHTRSGQTYLHLLEGEDDSVGAFYTVFDYLAGEDRFTWVDPVLSDAQLADSAAVLAQLHADAASFIPRGRRVEPRILELLPLIQETWWSCPAKSKGTVFDAHIAEQMDEIAKSVAATLAVLRDAAAKALPETVIHCDYHPGNLKFTGDAVTGVFDFDWSKVDFRLFDVGLALWYFCTSWQGAEDGSLRLDAVQRFLQCYQDRIAARLPSAAISTGEARYLPLMISAGNLYVLHWTVLDYFAKTVDPDQYLVFLDHSLHFNKWYAKPDNCAALETVIATVIPPSVP
jgi:homoserine kinase type II